MRRSATRSCCRRARFPAGLTTWSCPRTRSGNEIVRAACSGSCAMVWIRRSRACSFMSLEQFTRTRRVWTARAARPKLSFSDDCRLWRRRRDVSVSTRDCRLPLTAAERSKWTCYAPMRAWPSSWTVRSILPIGTRISATVARISSAAGERLFRSALLGRGRWQGARPCPRYHSEGARSAAVMSLPRGLGPDDR